MPPKGQGIESAVPQVTQAVAVGGATYHVVGRRDRAGFSFWVEHPRGLLWRHLNRPTVHGRSVAADREIVALTADDPALREVALASQWFEPTQRILRNPQHQAAEVWALSPMALEAFARQPEMAPPAGESLSPTLCAYLGIWVRGSLAHMHVAGAAVLGPAPDSRNVDDRLVLAVYPERLKEPMARLCATTTRGRRMVEWHADEPEAAEWLHAASAVAARTAMHVRVPTVAGRGFDVVLFGMSPSHFSALAAAALNAWPEIAVALRRDSVLTERELACLQYTADGYTADECAQMIGCSESNVRHHLSKAMRRLGAPNTVSAIQRAQLMGLLP
jgi:DNA-binding CsgD family transcriptional regulator